MSMKNPYENYRNNQVFTATREELTLMLYEGAVKFCNQAISALQNKDLIKANELIIKAENIILEFRITLKREYEVSKYLDSMYTYMYNRLLEANMTKDIAIIEEVRDLLREFRDTWREAMKTARMEFAAAQKKSDTSGK